jgi:flagellar FliL protein
MKLFKRGTDAAPDTSSDGTPTAAKSGSSNLIPAIVVAAGLIIGGFLFGGGGGDATPAEAAVQPEAHAGATEVATHGPVQNLEPITLNLADGRFLKVGLALQLAEVEGGGHGGGEELPSAKALDIAITHLGSYTMDELSSPKARELVKKKLSGQVAAAYVDPETHEPLVTKVYFTEFVMQ